MKSFIRIVSILSVAATSAGAALADEPSDVSSTGFDHPVAPVSQAFEIGLGGGYTQGAGDIANHGSRVQDISGPGGNLELKLGYRATPNFAIGLYGTYGQYGNADAIDTSTTVRSATAGVYADWHFRPDRSVDPWLGLSSAWRGMWLVPDAAQQTSLQGWEIARLQAGVDYRVTPEVALGPVIGASVNTFFTQSAPGTNGFEDISSPRPNFFFFAGLQGRFDVLGQKAPIGQGEAQQALR